MKATKFLILIVFVATAMFAGCKDEPVAMPEAEASVVANQAEEAEQQTSYLNGELVLGFTHSAYTPSSNADMELLCVQVYDTLHYFDCDAAFRAFCEVHGKLNVYEVNAKLDIVHAKAVELDIIEENGAKGDIPVPQEMEELWYELFGYDLEAGDGSKVNFIVRLSAGCYFSDFYSAENDWYVLPYKRTLGKMNGKVSAIKFKGPSVGATVFCYKTWFGGTRRWYWTFQPSPVQNGTKEEGDDGITFLLCNSDDNKKYHSYFTAL